MRKLIPISLKLITLRNIIEEPIKSGAKFSHKFSAKIAKKDNKRLDKVVNGILVFTKILIDRVKSLDKLGLYDGQERGYILKLADLLQSGLDEIKQLREIIKESSKKPLAPEKKNASDEDQSLFGPHDKNLFFGEAE